MYCHITGICYQELLDAAGGLTCEPVSTLLTTHPASAGSIEELILPPVTA